MTTLSLRLSDSLHRRVRELAKEERISINQFITTAVAEKMAALMTVDYLKDRARRGDRDSFLAVLAKVPDAPAEPGDEA
jgi:predicted transcriptional regulator